MKNTHTCCSCSFHGTCYNGQLYISFFHAIVYVIAQCNCMSLYLFLYFPLSLLLLSCPVVCISIIMSLLSQPLFIFDHRVSYSVYSTVRYMFVLQLQKRYSYVRISINYTLFYSHLRALLFFKSVVNNRCFIVHTQIDFSKCRC